MTREKLEQMLLSKIVGEYVDVNVKALYYERNTYDEAVSLSTITIKRIYKDGTITAVDGYRRIDEYALCELTADSILDLINDLIIWQEK